MGRNLSGSPCTNFSYLFFLLCLSLFACQMPTKDFGVCVYRTPTERRLVVFFLLCEKIIFPSRSFEKQGAKKVVQLTNSLFLCCGKKNQRIYPSTCSNRRWRREVEVKDQQWQNYYPKKKECAVFVAVARQRKQTDNQSLHVVIVYMVSISCLRCT